MLWDQEPDFVHNDIKFWLEASLTRWCDRDRLGKSLKGYKVFLTEQLNGYREYILVYYKAEKEGMTIYATQSQEAMAVYIDCLRIAQEE